MSSIPLRLFSRLSASVLLMVLTSLGLLLGTGDLQAQPTAYEVAPTFPTAEGTPTATACADGVVLDDGQSETSYGWVTSVDEGQYVQEFEVGRFATRRLSTVCVCWLRSSINNDPDLDFDIVFYDAVPAPEETFEFVPAPQPFAAVSSTATNVPTSMGMSFYEVDVSGVQIPATELVYIGVRWNAMTDQRFFICADKSPETTETNAYFRDELGLEWGNVFKTIDPIFLNHRALMIRADWTEEGTVEIPTLEAWGLVLLGFGLGVLGWRRIKSSQL